MFAGCKPRFLCTGNDRFPGVYREGKPPDNGTNTFINRLESKRKSWIILLEHV